VYERIAQTVPIPTWATYDQRQIRLRRLRALLDGTFYDKLPYSFLDEAEGRRGIPVTNKRPSVRYPLLREVAVSLARKLWAGSHFPRFVHKRDAVQDAAQALIDEGQLNRRLLRMSRIASVGSAAITFTILAGRIVYRVWWPEDCDPFFDAFDELERLRIRYVTSGNDLKARGFTVTAKGESLRPGDPYWYVQDLTTTEHITYYPMADGDWSPARDGVNAKLTVIADPEWTVTHNLGFVPGVWVRNLSEGEYPDGECTWWPAVPTAIHLDYTLSMLGRGLWYGASPQPVVKGELRNYEPGGPPGGPPIFRRGPATFLQVDADRKRGDVETRGADVKLLEMTGQWLTHAVEYVREARKLALEAIAASRKDPDNIRGNLSGKAMELLEDDTIDLLMELRTTHGDGGAVPVVRKSLMAARKMRHPTLAGVSVRDVDTLTAQWPLPFQPDPTDLQVFTTALMLAEQRGYVEREYAGTMWRNYADVPDAPAGTPAPPTAPPAIPAAAGDGQGGRRPTS
jgi:hypothetical protein